MRGRAVVAAMLVASACAGPERITPDVCGNVVLEPGEDCDTNADPTLGTDLSCVACRYACEPAGAPCPGGWACGADGVCRHATGAFVSAATIGEQATGIELGDIDGDGRADIIGAGALRLWGRLGSADARFTAGFTASGNLAGGLPAFDRLDGDDRIDFVFPLASGFVVLVGSDSGRFEFVSQPTLDLQSAGGVDLVPIRSDPAVPYHDFLGWAATDTFFALQLVPYDFSASAALVLADYHTVADLRGQAVAQLDPGQPGGEELALTFAGETRVRFFATGQDATGARFLVAAGEATLPEPVPANTGIALCDYDGDGAIDLLAPATTGLAVLRGDGVGGFAPAQIDVAFAGLGWPLAIDDLDGDGVADYVFPTGVYFATGGDLVQRFATAPGNAYRLAATGDFNRDGIVDVAGALAALPRLQILVGSEWSFFSDFLFETDAPLIALRTGDFDGDRTVDLALAEPSPLGDRLSVYFGDTTGPLAAPVFMGRLERIVGIDPAVVFIPGVATDVTTDLLVRSCTTCALGDTLGLYVIIGTVQRDMVSPFDLGGTARRIFLGRFSPGGDPDADVLSVTEPGSMDASLTLVHGHGNARFRIADRHRLAAAPIDDGTFDAACARFTAGDVDGDGHDDLIGLSSCGAPLLLVGQVAGDDAAPLFEATTQAWDETFTDPSLATLADVDGDQAVDLLIVYAGALVVYWNDGGQFDAGRRAILPDVTGAAVLNADADPARELAVGTSDGVYLAEVAGRVIDVAATAAIPAGGRPFAGDVDGDGLDDLLVADDDAVTVFLAVPHDAAGAPR